jgi:hypothetical protein
MPEQSPLPRVNEFLITYFNPEAIDSFARSSRADKKFIHRLRPSADDWSNFRLF